MFDNFIEYSDKAPKSTKSPALRVGLFVSII